MGSDGTWASAYLELLRKDSSLCLPTLDLASISDFLGIPEKTLKSRRAYRDDVRKAEREIVSEHLGRLKAQSFQERESEAREKAAAKDGESPEEDLPLVLERYLEVYGETDDRLGAVKALQNEGIPITLDDVIAAMQEYPAFDRAMRRLWNEGNVESEDQLRRKAREGKQAPLALYLRGNMPGKYGHRVKVDVSVTHQLGDEDRHLVQDVKDRFLPVPKRRQESESEDVVEGEVVGAAT